MKRATRYHPLIILFDVWEFVKNSIIVVIYLFAVKAGSQSLFITYGRIAFLVAVVFTFIFIILRWWTQRYELEEQSFHLYKGVFKKSERTIPFSRIQNVNRHTSLLHRLLKVTSIHFETGMAGEDATVTFEVITKKEADKITALVARSNQEEVEMVEEIAESNRDSFIEHDVPNEKITRTVHFTPTKKDTFKASFTSFSFLLLIPLIGSVYFKIDEMFQVEEEAKGIVAQVMSSGWIMMMIIIVLFFASVIFGITRTFIKYGEYEISSDSNQIYIAKGMLDQTSFSISKEKVQAIVITQTLLKRLFGLAEVYLISAGNLEIEDEKLDVSVLYPFLPEKRAYELITEILPTYEVTRTMHRLPKKSLWVRLLKPSWLWLLVTAGLAYFQPTIANIDQAWWIASIILLVFIVAFRVLDYFNTRYTMNEQFIQFKKGSLMTSLFLSKREKIIEVGVSRSPLQKMFGLASILTMNRAKPVHHSGLNDIPIEVAHDFYKWYVDRRNEIEME